jgi:uncharacterized membrane protein YeaQ/YmgE (transglycosylase-associated protein family)
MSFVMGFVVWTAAGLVAGWLAGRSERRPAAMRLYVVMGIAGAIAGGLLWSRWFKVQPGSTQLIYLFDFLSFHIFAALFGSTAGFWGLELVRYQPKTRLKKGQWRNT